MMPDTKNPFATARIVGKNVDPASYHAQKVERGHKDYVMSRSELCEFMHCPARWRAGYQRKDTDATEFGTLMDALLLDNDNFEKRFAVEPATYPAENGKEKKWTYQATYCKEWRAERESEGKLTVSVRDHAEAQRALSILLSEPDIAALIEQSDKQVHVTGEYHDRDTGITVPVQALLDIVPHAGGEFGNFIVDFKTANSAFPMVWQRHVFDYNYHVQAALFLDLYTLAAVKDPIERDGWSFLHLIQESYHPFQVGKRLLSAELIELGRLKYIAALRFYCACLHANVWPGYDNPEQQRLSVVIAGSSWTIVEPLPFMIQ